MAAFRKRTQIATAIAILFHVIGLVGILFVDRDMVARTSIWNLLLMFFLVLYTYEGNRNSLYGFALLCFITGMLAELIGTRTGWLFGEYAYGDVLGPAIWGVPLIIGINWFIIVYACGVVSRMLYQKIAGPVERNPSSGLYLLWMLDAALLAVAFDWLMEPVAVKLGYWTWLGNGQIPFYNYVCWFLVSFLLLWGFQRFTLATNNKFALHLLLIQSLFFLILRTAL